VNTPEEFEWSSFRGYSHFNNKSKIINRNYLLDMFSEDEKMAINLFLSNFSEMTDVRILDCDDEDDIKEGFDTNMRGVISDLLLKFNQKIPDIRLITDKKYRNLILNDIKKSTSASIRELSEILGISKDIIFRA